MTQDIQIEALDLSYSYRNPFVKALDGITFSVPSGNFIAVTGPNGSGKSTLLRIILGLLKPDSGAIAVMGLRPWENPSSVQRYIGYVPQTENVNSRIPLRVMDIVLQGATARLGGTISKKELAVRRDAVLEMVRITDLTDRQFSALSGGQQQRVLIARALAVDPKILILDEPFSAVDVASQQEITLLLRALADEKGVTIIAAVHNVNLLVHYLDSVLLLNRELIAFGSPDEVLQSDILKEAYGVEVPIIICEDGYRHPLMEDTHGRGT